MLDGSREGTGLGGLGKGVGFWKDARPDAKIAGEMPAGGALLEREVCARRILSRMSSLIRNSPLFRMLKRLVSCSQRRSLAAPQKEQV